MEKYFLVTVEETLSHTYKVKANSIEEAERKAYTAYDNANIVLGADDCCEHEITAREVNAESLEYYDELEG